LTSIRIIHDSEQAFKLGLHWEAIMAWAKSEGFTLYVANRESFWWEDQVHTGPALMTTDDLIQVAFRIRFF
jgi:hypothetical protein